MGAAWPRQSAPHQSKRCRHRSCQVAIATATSRPQPAHSILPIALPLFAVDRKHCLPFFAVGVESSLADSCRTDFPENIHASPRLATRSRLQAGLPDTKDAVQPTIDIQGESCGLDSLGKSTHSEPKLCSACQFWVRTSKKKPGGGSRRVREKREEGFSYGVRMGLAMG